jgi:Lipoate synthase
MLQDIEIKALKGESKNSASKKLNRMQHVYHLENRAGFALSTLPALKLINSKKLCVHKNYYRCEEAQCPNLGECFNHGHRNLMIMGRSVRVAAHL